MAFVKFKNIAVVLIMGLMSVNSIIEAGAHNYRVNSQNSVSNTFDAVISSLESSNKQVRKSIGNSVPATKPRDLNGTIQSFVDTLNTRANSKPIENYDVAYTKHAQAQHKEPSNQTPPVQTSPVSLSSRNKPKAVINTSLDWMNKTINVSDQDFNTALNSFKRNRDFGQLAVQHVIDLLDVELNLVRHLVAGHTGASVQAALDDRNSLLLRTIPLAVTLYDTILTVATNDNKHNATLNNRINNGKRLPKALTIYDQKMFLSSIENKIEQYQDVMRNIQHTLAYQSAPINQDDFQDEREKMVNDYLAERA